MKDEQSNSGLSSNISGFQDDSSDNSKKESHGEDEIIVCTNCNENIKAS